MMIYITGLMIAIMINMMMMMITMKRI